MRHQPELDEAGGIVELDLGLAEPEEVVARARARLEEQPRHPPSYQTLRAIFTDQGQYDQAWCVCAVMTYLGCATGRERLYYETYKPGQLGRSGEPLPYAAWSRIVHPAVDDPLMAVIAGAIGHELALVHAHPLRRYRLHPKRRRDTQNDQLALSRALDRAANLLNVAIPDLYLQPDRPGGLSLANLVHHRRLSPSLLAGGGVLRGRDPRELDFIAGRILTYLRSDFFLTVALPDQTELREAWGAALAVARSVATRRPDSQPGGDSARSRLERSLSPRARAELALAVNGTGLCFERFDLDRWRAAVDITTQRIGLVLCGDPAIAAGTLAGETAPACSAAQSAKIDALLRYAISEDYFAVRRHLQGTIGASRASPRVAAAA